MHSFESKNEINKRFEKLEKDYKKLEEHRILGNKTMTKYLNKKAKELSELEEKNRGSWISQNIINENVDKMMEMLKEIVDEVALQSNENREVLREHYNEHKRVQQNNVYDEVFPIDQAWEDHLNKGLKKLGDCEMKKNPSRQDDHAIGLLGRALEEGNSEELNRKVNEQLKKYEKEPTDARQTEKDWICTPKEQEKCFSFKSILCLSPKITTCMHGKSKLAKLLEKSVCSKCNLKEDCLYSFEKDKIKNKDYFDGCHDFKVGDSVNSDDICNECGCAVVHIACSKYIDDNGFFKSLKERPSKQPQQSENCTKMDKYLEEK
ncbi:hypothetical protein LCGC14_1402980 [marine sediment metagenome]|uniref:Uncharacterized protein n=1 Tax=marine sediment metagenome TaxID=412755 RepID=A0A0F9MY31_9ZZZZ